MGIFPIFKLGPEGSCFGCRTGSAGQRHLLAGAVGAGGGQRVSEQLTQALGYDVPLMAQLPLEPEVRETGEAGRPAVLDADGALRTDGIGQTFRGLAERLLAV